MGALSPPRGPSLTRLKIKALCRCTRVKPPHALGACCTEPAPGPLCNAAACVLVRRPRGRGPRFPISRSASQAMLVFVAVPWRPVVMAGTSPQELGLRSPSSWVAGAAEEQRTRCGEAAVAESASDVTTMHLLLVEDRAMDLHAKHEIDRLGLVRVLELLVCYEGHHEAWLERSRHGLGCQG